ncbi:head GIN domain-containing protein [Sphingomonas panacis]|uniref:head GIN domain-containing protein n=1 Tax=Sphingomonas panacis TaxID=1560345 RepID=UPI001F0AE52B|nr:head GIN domain-containing protein [Sphingomonas panacis]
MKHLLAALPLLCLAVPAAAEQRSFAIGSFDRVRIDGPFRVIVTLGGSPGGSAEGDARAISDLDVRVDGGTLIVRAGLNGWGEQGGMGRPSAPVVRVSTQAIRSIVTVGAAQVSVGGPFRGQRLDLSLTGSGTLAAPSIDADQLFATVLGSGTITLGGRAAKARLTTSGTASIAAASLVADDLTVRLDGNGAIDAQARYTAAVTTSGLGTVTVYGKPACTVNAVAGGPVSCGRIERAPAQ